MRQKSLSNAEKYLIRRRRLGLTQAEFATDLGVTRKAYNQFEKGYGSNPGLRGGVWLHMTLRNLSPEERCLILRRRAQRTQAQVARDIGCSRWWVLQMERGTAPVDTLVEYWSDRGTR